MESAAERGAGRAARGSLGAWLGEDAERRQPPARGAECKGGAVGVRGRGGRA